MTEPSLLTAVQNCLTLEISTVVSCGLNWSSSCTSPYSRNRGSPFALFAL